MAFAVPEQIKEELALKATHALVFHESGGGNTYDRGKASLITRHPVHQSPEGPVIGAGSLLSLTDQEILRDILNNNTEAGSVLLPANMLVSSSRRLVWHVPAAVRTMYLNINTRIKRLKVPWPALVMRVDSGTLYVAALSASSRPNDKTKLYRAPLANVYHDGRVCTGDADIPGGWRIAHMKSWESVIFDTAYSHINNPVTLRLGGSGNNQVNDAQHFAFWRQLALENASRFPTKALYPMNMTLRGWLADGRDR